MLLGLGFHCRIITLLLLWPCLASSAAEIRWFQHHAPPMYNIVNHQGETLQATGIVNRIIDFFDQQLPQHQMKRVVMTSKRFWHELKAGNNYCRMDALKTPQRQQWAVYSIPISIAPPASIVMHQKDWLAQGKPAELNLAALLNNAQYRGAAIATASFGAIVDEIFQANTDSVSFKRKTAKPHALLGMVNLRRIHYSVEFPIYVQSYLVEHPAHPLQQIKIQEEVDYYPLHIACTKNAWGQNVVLDLNPVLAEYRFTDAFVALIEEDGQLYNEHVLRQLYEDVTANE